jgi:prepilin-type N-terminal cleavage/methylation domain-containing protein
MIFPPTPSAPSPRASGGFSLVEVLVALAVLAVAVAVFVPMYVAGLPEARLKAAARTLAGDLRYARSLAVADDAPYFVCFGGAGTYRIDRVDDPAAATDCDSADTPNALTEDLSARYPGVRFGFAAGVAACPAGAGTPGADVVFTAGRAVFNPRGASVTGSAAGAPVQVVGLVYLTNPDTAPQRTYCLHVLGAVGNVRPLRWDTADGSWVS